eukprot:COSAG01_NODE_2228_length_8130_cov_11.575395_12_plen_177_part_00
MGDGSTVMRGCVVGRSRQRGGQLQYHVVLLGSAEATLGAHPGGRLGRGRCGWCSRRCCACVHCADVFGTGRHTRHLPIEQCGVLPAGTMVWATLDAATGSLVAEGTAAEPAAAGRVQPVQAAQVRRPLAPQGPHATAGCRRRGLHLRQQSLLELVSREASRRFWQQHGAGAHNTLK